MRRVLITGSASLLAVALIAAAAETADAASLKRHKPRVVKAVTSAETAGAIATATASCPKETRPRLGPWRAISGGFDMTTWTTPALSDPQTTPVVPFGSGVVYESRKVGQRSWRVSAQSLWGAVNLKVYVNCQRGVPKTTSASSTVATPGTAQIGPATVARCRSGRAVAGGFSTPPPFTATGAANTVIGSMPSGRGGWKAQVLSNQASALTSYVYCARRKRARLRRSFVGEPSSAATLEDTLAYATAPDCPAGRFTPGGGGFSQQGLTTSQYLIPTKSRPTPFVWTAHAIKAGSGTPVTLVAVALCG